MKRVYLGLGSNVGNKLKNCFYALKRIKDLGVLEAVSSPYVTSPYGYTTQPWFVNLVCRVRTELSPFELLRRCQEIEKDMGRVRVEKWGPRVIDIDILFYDGSIIETRELSVPHPELHKRLFVLVPMAEIDKNFLHPRLGKSINELLRTGDFQNQTIRRIQWRSAFQSLT